MNLYDNIIHYCRIKNISPYQLCKEANISHSTISDLKSGRCKDIKLSAAARIAKVLNITIDELAKSK